MNVKALLAKMLKCYEEKELLWSNVYATASFAQQDIPLSLSKYDFIEVWFIGAGSPDVFIQNPLRVAIGGRNDILCLHTMRDNGVNQNTGVRSVIAASDKVTVGNYSYKNRSSGGTLTVANQFCIPEKIYGIKLGGGTS